MSAAPPTPPTTYEILAANNKTLPKRYSLPQGAPMLVLADTFKNVGKCSHHMKANGNNIGTLSLNTAVLSKAEEKELLAQPVAQSLAQLLAQTPAQPLVQPLVPSLVKLSVQKLVQPLVHPLVQPLTYPSVNPLVLVQLLV